MTDGHCLADWPLPDPTRPARSAGHVGDLKDLLAEAIIPAVDAG